MSDPSYAFRGETSLTQVSQGNQAHLSCGRLSSPRKEGRCSGCWDKVYVLRLPGGLMGKCSDL